MATDGRLPEVAVPGKILGAATHYIPGPGTHLHNNQVVSSLLGRVSLSGAPGRAGPAKRLTKITARGADELPTVSVIRGERRREVLPDVGAAVLCRVTRLMTKQAIVSIQQVGGTVLETEWQGVIRSQDVRATEKDKVKIYESFRPGDTVRAQVVSSFSPLTRSPHCSCGWDADGSSFRLDFARRPGELLPLHGVERAGRHHGDERGRQRHGAGELEGVQGPTDGAERAEEGREAELERRQFGRLTRGERGHMISWALPLRTWGAPKLAIWPFTRNAERTGASSFGGSSLTTVCAALRRTGTRMAGLGAGDEAGRGV